MIESGSSSFHTDTPTSQRSSADNEQDESEIEEQAQSAHISNRQANLEAAPASVLNSAPASDLVINRLSGKLAKARKTIQRQSIRLNALELEQARKRLSGLTRPHESEQQ